MEKEAHKIRGAMSICSLHIARHALSNFEIGNTNKRNFILIQLFHVSCDQLKSWLYNVKVLSQQPQILQ